MVRAAWSAADVRDLLRQDPGRDHVDAGELLAEPLVELVEPDGRVDLDVEVPAVEAARGATLQVDELLEELAQVVELDGFAQLEHDGVVHDGSLLSAHPLWASRRIRRARPERGIPGVPVRSGRDWPGDDPSTSLGPAQPGWNVLL